MLQSGGTLYVNGGELDVTGDYYIAGSRSIGDDGKENVTSCHGILKMMKDTDVVKVDGDFLTFSTQEHGEYLTAGVMYIGGDITQKPYNYEGNFNATGNHKVVLNGKEKQTLRFSGYSDNGFANVEFQNKDIEFASSIRGFELGEDINLTISTENFGVSGTWKLNGHSLGEGGINGTEQLNFTTGTIDFGGSTVKINGDLLQSGGTLYVNGGELDVTGDYYIAGSRGVGEDGKETITSCSAILKMMKDADVVRVDGDFLTASNQNHGNYLIAGTMYLGGNFTQKSSSSYNFAASGTHTAILDSETKQNITFESTASYFNNLKLMKDKETGYTFNPDNCWINLYMESNVKDVTITPNEVTVSQNDTQQFIAKVNGFNGPDQSVNWEISGNTSENTTISNDGLLKVPLEEEAEFITVKATSVQDTSKSAEVTVTIAKAIPEVYWVKISPNNLGLSRGDMQTFKATVTGVNNPSQNVVWSVEGNESEQTFISQEGVLQIAADETANVITVKAISVQDETKENHVEVAVLDSEDIIYDSTVNRVLMDVQSADMELGSSRTFTAKVLGTNSPSQIVEWTIEGNISENTWIDAEGKLTISDDEEAEQITVKAASVQNTEKYAVATVNVIKMKIISTIEDVAIVLAPGESLRFKAKVLGTNEPSQEVEWVLDGNESPQTTVSEDGLLVVAEDETADMIMLTARSIGDSTKSATVVIGIEQSEEEEPGDIPVNPGDGEQDDDTPLNPGDGEQEDDSGDKKQPEEDTNITTPGTSDNSQTVVQPEKMGEQAQNADKQTEKQPIEGSVVTDSVTNADYAITEQGKTVEYKKVRNQSVKTINVPSAITVNGTTYKVTSVAKNAFSGCKKLKKVTIGKNITMIGDNAFKKCLSLKKVIIPAKVTSIGKNAFSGCKNLKNVIVKSKKLKKIGKNAFKGINKSARIKVPKNKMKVYQKLLKKAKLSKNIQIIN